MSNKKVVDFLVARYVDNKNLNMDVSGKKPVGFSFGRNNHVVADSWIEIYLEFLEYLHSLNSVLFFDLPFNKNAISKQGYLYFATKRRYVRTARKISKQFFIETNLSANSIIKNISMLSDIFNVNKNEIMFYIKKD